VSRAIPPFFLVGNPRSGTKMLRELLNTSPEVWISAVESHFIPKYTRRVARYGDLSDRRNFAALAAALSGTRAFWQWARRGIHIDPETWYAACRSYTWPGVLEGLFHVVHDLEVPEARTPWQDLVWGDKTPGYMSELPLLAALFPAARVIHIVRDPRDCVLSTAAAWGNSPLRTAQEWADRTRQCRAAGQALGPERFLELRYEDLVTDVEGLVGRCFAFLGLPVPPDAGRLYRVPENLGTQRGQSQVVSSSAGRWKRTMASPLRKAVEALTGDLLDVYGYEREYPGLRVRRLGGLRLGAYRLRDAWRQLQFRRRELGSWREAIRFLRAR